MDAEEAAKSLREMGYRKVPDRKIDRWLLKIVKFVLKRIRWKWVFLGLPKHVNCRCVFIPKDEWKGSG